MQRAAPVKEPCEEGSVYLFLQMPASSTFIIGNKAKWFTLKGVCGATTNGSMFYIAVVGEELFIRRCCVGSFW